MIHRSGHQPGWHRRLCRLAIPAALLGFATGAQALTVPGLANTGVDAGGALLALGATDLLWTVQGPGISGSMPAVVVSNQHPAGQYYADPGSLWIWQNASGAGTVNAPYTFTLSFDLSGINPNSFSLSGFWGADNFANMLVNGAAPIGTGTFAVTGTQFQNFNTQQVFTVTGGFVAGLNTLQFQVTDTGNPGGLDVGGLTPAVPEPSSGLLLAVGGTAGLMAARWRRRRVTA